MPVEHIFAINDTLNGDTKTYELRNQEIEGGITLHDIFEEKHIYLNLDETKRLISFLEYCVIEHENLMQ